MLDQSKQHPRIWRNSSQLHNVGRMSKCLYRYVQHDLRCCGLGTEQRRALLLDSDVNRNRRFYGNWSHHSLRTESTKPEWVSFVFHTACYHVTLRSLFLCNTLSRYAILVGWYTRYSPVDKGTRNEIIVLGMDIAYSQCHSHSYHMTTLFPVLSFLCIFTFCGTLLFASTLEYNYIGCLWYNELLL